MKWTAKILPRSARFLAFSWQFFDWTHFRLLILVTLSKNVIKASSEMRRFWSWCFILFALFLPQPPWHHSERTSENAYISKPMIPGGINFLLQLENILGCFLSKKIRHFSSIFVDGLLPKQRKMWEISLRSASQLYELHEWGLMISVFAKLYRF